MTDDEQLHDDHRRAAEREDRREANPADRLQPGKMVDDHTDDREEQLWQGGYSSKAMIGAWIMAALVSFGLLGGAVFGALGTSMGWLIWVCLALILLLWLWLGGVYLYRRMSVQYELTTQRFLHREGILSRRTERIEVIDMDDITCTQGFVQRLVGVGTIKIESSDRTHPELYLKGIDDVLRIADLIDDTRRKERRRRGLHIESI